MVTTSSITMQSLGKIVQRASTVSAKIWCLYVFTGRILQSGKLPVLNLLTGQKSGFSPSMGADCTDSREMWHSRGAHGSAWLCKISPPSAQGNAAPKYQKISTFWLRVASQGRTPWTISNFYGLLYALLSYISVSNLMWFTSQFTELLLRNHCVRQLSRIFPCTL